MSDEGFQLGFKKNPVLMLAFGLCPVLAVTTSLYEALAIGICVLFMGVFLSALIASFDQYLSPEISPFAWLLVSAFLATISGILVGMLDPFLEMDLGIYVPLLAVNCMIQGQIAYSRLAPSFGIALSRNFGMAIAFTLILAVIAVIREVLGNGTISLIASVERKIILELPLLSEHPIRFFLYAGGAFIVFGYTLAASRFLDNLRKRNKS